MNRNDLKKILIAIFISILVPATALPASTGVSNISFLNVYKGTETSLAGTPHALAPSIAIAGNTPYIIWSEIDRSGISFVHVRHREGNRWILDGDILNISRTHHGAFPDIVYAIGHIYAAWSEIESGRVSRIYVKRWTGKKWARVGDSINVNPKSYAFSPILAGNESFLYVAWAELNSSQISQVYIKQWDGKEWKLIGNINKDSKRHAFFPSMVADRKGLYVAWTEYNDDSRAITHVSHWDGKEWKMVGEPINIDTMKHAFSPSMALSPSGLYISWVEYDKNNIFQVHVKKWNGQKWKKLRESLNMNPLAHATSPVIIVQNNTPYVAWTEIGNGGISRIYIKSWKGGKWIPYNSNLNTAMTTAPDMAGDNSAIYITFSEIDPDGIFRLYARKVEKEPVPSSAVSIQISRQGVTKNTGRIFFTAIPQKQNIPPPIAYKYLPKTQLGEVDWMGGIREGLLKPYDSTDPDAPPSLPPLEGMDLLLSLKKGFNIPGVIFPHKSHTMWLDCRNCHPSIFVPRRGANPITMHRIIDGEYCGRCHGIVAFRLYDCFRCHSAVEQ